MSKIRQLSKNNFHTSGSYPSKVVHKNMLKAWKFTKNQLCQRCFDKDSQKFLRANIFREPRWHMLLIIFNSFHDRGPYHIETSTSICRANQWTGFYIIGTSVMKELMSGLCLEN